MTAHTFTFLLCLLVFMQRSYLVEGSHFRHAFMSFAPTDADNNTIHFTFRLAFRRSSIFCDENTINTGGIIGHGNNWIAKCSDYSSAVCSQTFYLAKTRFHCTDFSRDEDWSMGENNFTYSFPSSNLQWTVSYQSCCWISNLVRYADSSWLVSTKVNLYKRSDNGKINSSPVSRSPAIVRFQQGCHKSLRIPVEDPDGDFVKCRWATYAESFIRNDSFSYGELDEKNCVLTYRGGRAVSGTYVLTLTLEDFPAGTTNFNNIRPFSAVPLHFLVIINNASASCQDIPVFTASTPQNGECSEIQIGSVYRAVIEVQLPRVAKHIVEINTNSPLGMQLTPLRFHGGIYFRNVTWYPNQNQVGQQMFCFQALDSDGLQSEWRCVTILVGLNIPVFTASTPQNGECSEIQIGSVYRAVIEVQLPRVAKHIVEINTNSPLGMQLTPLRFHGGIYFRNVTWYPNQNQVGQQMFCFQALDSDGDTQLFLGNTPRVILETRWPISPLSEIGTGLIWWSVHFDRLIKKPRSSAFIRLVLQSNGFTVFKVNALSSYVIIDSNRTALHFATPKAALSMNGSYAILIDHGAVVGQGCSYDGPPTPGITSPKDWAFPVYGVCPVGYALAPPSFQKCEECYNHSYLQDAERGMGHYNGFYGNVDCDRYTLQPGWYRFLGAAGTEMPTSCVGRYRCGTHITGWLSGQHPSVADGIVYVKVCFHWHSSCCQWSAYIRVRNCSGFYVYELVPVPYCSSRFCGNGGGNYSSTSTNIAPSPASVQPMATASMYVSGNALHSTSIAPTPSQYIAVATPAFPGNCFHHLNYSYGSFESPGKPGCYPNNKECAWLLEAPVGRHVYLYFSSFHLEYGGSHCPWDYVTILDGNSLYSPVLFKACGQLSWFGLYSSGRFLMVLFHSDGVIRMPGFYASFYATSYNAGNNFVLSSLQVSFTSHGQCLPTQTQTATPTSSNDVDECLISNGGCSHHCYNIPGSFYCGCPDGTSMGANNLTCVEPGVSVNCSDFMTVALEKKTFPFFDATRLHLRYSSCRATQNDTHLLISTLLNDCGTLVNETEDDLIFWNEIRTDVIVIDNVITRSHDIKIPFYCSYSRKKWVNLGFKPQHLHFGTEAGYGNFTFKIDFYKSSSFATPYTEQDYPLSVPINQYLYVRYSVESSADLVIMAVTYTDQNKQTALIGGLAGAGGFALIAVAALAVLFVKYRIARRFMNRNKVGDQYATQDEQLSRRNAYVQPEDMVEHEDSF
ncbi:Pancreatic secretory granule membrane major glycoprotein GP2 [Stylophora pistillata]|uniref:Pancreatic secretory granule membrane major glycoprotein GP2 n=1 Tax=Stylophora pistillata TaxID=50429 RepID=A0A2B4S313_STYPI|nr:Pancreatic secretory granule membrane major glycoprotein GP2 [Stylophora pistillata]